MDSGDSGDGSGDGMGDGGGGVDTQLDAPATQWICVKITLEHVHVPNV